MHEIEPFYNWRVYYTAEEDERSPFYGTEYSEFEFSQKVYNYYIHPQWDSFGSATLYLKILHVNYGEGSAIIEFIGEWNDAISNDIMLLKRDLIDELIHEGISRFVLIGENVLNFHGEHDSYYEEWVEDIQDDGGWLVAVNFREHVIDEMREHGVHYFVHFIDAFNNMAWRKLKPDALVELLDQGIIRALD